jgi:hypothetical protein
MEITMNLNPVMNTTKWHELRMAMFRLAPMAPRWRTRCVSNGHVTAWDSEWFYHFRDGGYDIIEWVEIETTSIPQDTAVFEALAKIHVPGEKLPNGYRVYGYLPSGVFADFFSAPESAGTNNGITGVRNDSPGRH